MNDPLLRPLAAGELDLFETYPDPPTSGVGARRDSYRELVAAGQYRPQWTWVAVRDGRVVARSTTCSCYRVTGRRMVFC